MFQKKRIVASLLGVTMSASVLAPCVMAEEKADYATREYVISQFVQSVGRNELEESEAVLDMFTDSDKISDKYREDLSRAVVGGILKGYVFLSLKKHQRLLNSAMFQNGQRKILHILQRLDL